MITRYPRNNTANNSYSFYAELRGLTPVSQSKILKLLPGTYLTTTHNGKQKHFWRKQIFGKFL
jgi:hypothetical protein